MVKKKSSIFLIVFLIFILIISIVTIYKMNKKHEEKLYKVLYSEIEYKSKKCYLDKICGEEFTLSDLYDKKYLSIMYDPISKKELNKDLKIIVKDEKVIIDK